MKYANTQINHIQNHMKYDQFQIPQSEKYVKIKLVSQMNINDAEEVLLVWVLYENRQYAECIKLYSYADIWVTKYFFNIISV